MKKMMENQMKMNKMKMNTMTETQQMSMAGVDVGAPARARGARLVQGGNRSDQSARDSDQVGLCAEDQRGR
jgi:hypothetical protein